jgi:hypothetical protein
LATETRHDVKHSQGKPTAWQFAVSLTDILASDVVHDWKTEN